VPPLYKLLSSFLSNGCGTKSTPSKTSQHKATRDRSQLKWDYQHTPSRSGRDFQQYIYLMMYTEPFIFF